MSRKTLLVVTSTFPRWHEDTVPTFVFDLATRMANDYDIIVVAPHAKGAFRREMMAGIEVIRYRYCVDAGEMLAYNSGIINNLKNNPINYLLIMPFLFSQLCTVVKLLRSKKIDIIHAHWSFPQGLIAAFALMLTRSKVYLVCTLHGSDLSFNKNIFRFLHQFVFRKASVITVVSHSLRNLAITIGAEPSKLNVMPMGVDAQTMFAENEIAKQRNDLLFVGRLIKSKGVDILLRAMSIITLVHPRQQLIIVGDGDERENLEELAETLNISKNIIFAGSIQHSQLPIFYKQAAIFISPTLAEGFGLTLIEALACGCAVVVSDLPAVRDIIDNQQTGLMFEVGNPQALAHCVLTLLDDKVLRDKLAKRGQEKALKNFDWEIATKKYQSLFDLLLKV